LTAVITASGTIAPSESATVPCNELVCAAKGITPASNRMVNRVIETFSSRWWIPLSGIDKDDAVSTERRMHRGKDTRMELVRRSPLMVPFDRVYGGAASESNQNQLFARLKQWIPQPRMEDIDMAKSLDMT
jgi:hypothetical protein